MDQRWLVSLPGLSLTVDYKILNRLSEMFCDVRKHANAIDLFTCCLSLMETLLQIPVKSIFRTEGKKL